jgi:hypothetical protein
VTFTYKETGPDRAKMTAEVEGSIFTDHLEKSGVTLPLSHANVEQMFPNALPPRRAVGISGQGSSTAPADCAAAPSGGQDSP